MAGGAGSAGSRPSCRSGRGASTARRGNRRGAALGQHGRRASSPRPSSARRSRRPTPVGRGREPEEVDVVRVVGHRIETLRPALGDVVLVGGDGELVASSRRRSGPRAGRCARHVHHVAGRRHQRQQRVGGLSARSGAVVASTRWMSMCSAAGCFGVAAQHVFGERRRSPACPRAAGRRASSSPTGAGPSSTPTYSMAMSRSSGNCGALRASRRRRPCRWPRGDRRRPSSAWPAPR